MNEVGASVLLVADDGPDFGLGHLRRLEYLQKTLEPEIRQRSILISRETYPPACRSKLRHKPFWQEVCEEMTSIKPFLCVFDLSYTCWEQTWAQVLLAMQPSAESIAIDVPLDWVSRFDHVIHPGIVKSEFLEGLANWHGGPEWVLAKRDPTWIQQFGVPKVTVLTGSQAFESFQGWLTPQLEKLTESKVKVNWVVGKHREEKIPQLNSGGSAVTYVSDALLAARFAASTVVLTRFGVTAFESTAQGVPTIILPGWTESEEREVMAFERCGVALVAKSESEVGHLAHQLAHDMELQQALSTTSRNFFELKQEHPASRLVSQIASEQING